MADLERRAEAPARAAQAHEHAVVVVAAVLEVGDRARPRRALTASTGRSRRGPSAIVRCEPKLPLVAAEGDRQPRAPDVGRPDRAVGQRDGPRLRVGLDGDGARRRAALGAERGRAGRARRQAPSASVRRRPCRPATPTTPGPCRRRRPSRRRDRRTDAAADRFCAGDHGGSAMAAAGSARASSQASATRRRIMVLQRHARGRGVARCSACIVLTAGNIGSATIGVAAPCPPRTS